MNKYVITVRNTCTGLYEEVEVTKNVYETYKRAEWKDEKNDLRFHQHQIPFSCLIGNEDNALENFHEFVDISLIQNEESFTPDDDVDKISVIHRALRCLNESERLLIENLYFYRRTERDLASEWHVSHQAIHKRKSRILTKLKKKILEN